MDQALPLNPQDSEDSEFESLHVLPSFPDDPVGEGDFIRQLIVSQQTLSAVEQFATAYDQSELPAQAKYYSKLLPATGPDEGEQYGFEVDLDRCSGCKACVAACHSLNGLDEQETWRDVGLLTGGTSQLPVVQHVTTACHHCLEPACMNGCPVNAYEKDPVTGIVKHLDDQCFGCQYCTLACPYDVPKYHASKGIVRKCDMCSDRLAVGEAPACVQSCPHEAISIRIVNKKQVIEDAEADPFLPAAPDPQITLPTTRYKTSRVFPRNLLPADYYSINPQHPHWPLIIMLVLTQLSVGAFIVSLILDRTLGLTSYGEFPRLHASMTLGFGLLALGSSTMHLGRPLYAFRAFLGVKHSWLSREIIAFGAFAKTAILFAAASWLFPNHWTVPYLAGAVAVTGVIGVFCSAMIYVFTGRDFWSFRRTILKFNLSGAMLGIAATWLSILVFGTFVDSPGAHDLAAATGRPLVHMLVGATLLKIALELSLFRHLLFRRNSPLKRSARLLIGPLSSSLFARLACGLLGGVIMPLFVLGEIDREPQQEFAGMISVAMLFVACLGGELLERFHFFAASASPRMPGRLGA